MPTVVGLVGGSGTGKSHRASMVAIAQGCDAIIDDGLFIREGKILAGESAKRAPSKIEAVRRAIFLDPDAAREVREALLQANPEGILILGTSRPMVERICQTLLLPTPGVWIDIESLADPHEIRLAREIRTTYGRHVIPAPTVEVRKTFSGYMVDPLHFILRKGHDPSEDVVVEKSVVRPTWSYLGKFTVDDTVVAAIAAHAAESVPGIVAVRRAVVETWKMGVTVDLDVTVAYGTHIPSVLDAGRDRLVVMVQHMTALNVLNATLIAKRVVMPREQPLVGAPSGRAGRG